MKEKSKTMHNFAMTRATSFSRVLSLAMMLGLALMRPAFAQIDPVVALTPNFSTVWNSAGNTGNWTGSGWSTLNAKANNLAGEASGANPSISRTGITNGPDLDLGYNDFVDVRVAIPATFTGSLVLSYGVANAGIPDQTGFHSSREVVLPNSKLIKDSAAHTYRMDVGLVTLWRGTLSDLRITLRGAATGQNFYFEYIRIGDETGNNYQARISENCPAGNTQKVVDGKTLNIRSIESKRFRVIWSDVTETEDPNVPWNSEMAKGTLRNLEECWQVYVKKLGYREPCYPMESPASGSVKYKTNLTLIHGGGTWAPVDSDPAHGGSFGTQNSYPAATRVDPPSWATPHELMHVFQNHNTSGNMPGNWWESHANYGCERWLEHYEVLFPDTSSLSGNALGDANLSINPGRNFYVTWPLYYYLDTNPDKLPGLGEGTMVKIWQNASANTSPYTTLKNLASPTSLKDIIGHYAKRMATLDFPGRQEAMKNAAGASLQNSYTELERVPDNSGWWRSPQEKAPAQGGYTIHPIVPSGSGAGRVVTVDFRGLANSYRGADWRASLVVESGNGTTRYSTLWNQGTNSVTLAANENQVYLVVAATPDTFAPSEIDDLAFPYRSDPSKQRMHYEVKITGGQPLESTNGPTTRLVQHSNGGGWKSPQATVASTAFVGPNARVLDSAQVLGNARIEDFAVVKNDAIVKDNAIVSGHSLVGESAVIRDHARIRDRAKVQGTAEISGNAHIIQSANIIGTAKFGEVSSARSTAIVWGGTLGGGATLDGDLAGEVTSNNGFAFGHASYVGVPPNWIREAPDRILAAYDFAAPQDTSGIDSHGSLTAFLRGAPLWSAGATTRRGFLTFNGSNQWICLDRTLADAREFSFSAWIKPEGGSRNQTVLWMGSTPSRRMVFTPQDQAGRAKFSIRNGGADQSLTAPEALPVNIWSHVAITLNGQTGNLYVNGKSVANGTITIRPEDLLAENNLASVQHNYLARSEGNEQPMFKGSLDSVEFYLKALTPAEIADKQPILKVAGKLLVDLRATDFSNGTWVNRGTLGNFTAISSPLKVASVNGTGIAGVQFDGTSAFQGPVSNGDIDGSSDRSVEAWVFNPDFSNEETVVSWGHRGSTRQNMAINFGSNPAYGATTQWDDDLGWETTPTAGQWHHIAYVYTRGTAKMYLDGVLAISKTLGAPLNTFAGEPINIACQRESANGARQFFFTGFINSVRIHSGALSASQVAGNYNLGPEASTTSTGSVPSINSAPTAFGTVGFAFRHQITATNNSTTFGASSLPAGLTLNATSGLISGIPTGAGVFSTNLTASNSQGTGSANLVITIGGNIAATVGTPFSYKPSSENATSFTVSGSLPSGLSLNATSGVIFGTPARVETKALSVTPKTGTTSGAPVPFNIVVSNPPPPAITSLFVNGNNATATISAYNTFAAPLLELGLSNTGNNPLRFQWRLNGAAISGATNATFSIGNATAAKAGIYDAVVTNAIGVSTTSRPVVFSLLPSSTFKIDGSGNSLLPAGSNATFTANVTAKPPRSTTTFQWFKDGVAINGATAAQFTTLVSPSTAGAYSVRVTTKVRNTTIGTETSPKFAVAPQDARAGVLIYRLSGNATRTQGIDETSGTISGYLVVDRINNNAAIIQTYGTGSSRRNSLEMRNDIAMASTGPIPGSRSVIVGSLNNGDTPVDHDIVWISGRDSKIMLARATAGQPALKIIAPSSLNGVLGVLARNSPSVEIDSFTVQLSLDQPLTATAYRNSHTLLQAIDNTRATAVSAGFLNDSSQP